MFGVLTSYAQGVQDGKMAEAYKQRMAALTTFKPTVCACAGRTTRRRFSENEVNVAQRHCFISIVRGEAAGY